jgi:hypothetical protein
MSAGHLLSCASVGVEASGRYGIAYSGSKLHFRSCQWRWPSQSCKATFFVRAQFKENMSVIVGGGYSDWIPRDIYKERR